MYVYIYIYIYIHVCIYVCISLGVDVLEIIDRYILGDEAARFSVGPALPAVDQFKRRRLGITR
jgi:hypothetical protein